MYIYIYIECVCFRDIEYKKSFIWKLTGAYSRFIVVQVFGFWARSTITTSSPQNVYFFRHAQLAAQGEEEAEGTGPERRQECLR